MSLQTSQVSHLSQTYFGLSLQQGAETYPSNLLYSPSPQDTSGGAVKSQVTGSDLIEHPVEQVFLMHESLAEIQTSPTL